MKIRLALVLCLFSFTLHASQKAVTDEGDIVILNDDGTWIFENPGAIESVEIPVNEQAFEKSPDSSFRLKSTHNDSAVWLNTKSGLLRKIRLVNLLNTVSNSKRETSMVSSLPKP